jgi:rubrerythrin
MTEQEQIEEMSRVIDATIERYYKSGYEADGDTIAPDLYAAGYRKQTYGKWMVCGIFDDIFKCSVCGREYTVFEAAEHNFCPHCGAKMKGGA